MKTARRLIAIAGFFLAVVLMAGLGFLAASMIGAVLPRVDSPSSGMTAIAGDDTDLASAGSKGGANSVTIFLLSGLLHTDIAIPVDALPDNAMARLRQTRLPLDNPRLEYLAFGWGSKDFYTTAGEYSDIRFATAWKAATGDVSVMRVTGLPMLEPGENLLPLTISQDAIDQLLAAIFSTFDESTENSEGGWLYLPEYSIGPADAFFAAKGDFNLFNPCNQWTGDMLARAGIATGRWTPTTHSLLWSIDWHGQK